MSVSGVFSKGRGVGHDAAVSILRYIPRARVPWQPSRFGRENLSAEDLARLWGRGRYRDGPGNYNSGYSTERTHVLEDHTVAMIPKHELERYMPDISIGPKALVTPVSLMHARHGHRVTHDMIHAYDAHIGRLGKPALVDHENISVDDPNRVGLNAATLDCRGRIHRWLRRGPFMQEDHYFRRSTRLNRDGSIPSSAHEAPLMRKIIRLARRGHLKAACEEYRRITTIPPVDVYRALTACCIPSGNIADAVAIFEDGDSRLFYVSRDGEVLHNVMRCAIRAKHRVRIMWVYNVMRGRYYENVIVRAEIDSIWRFRIAQLALAFFLDAGCAEEAGLIYRHLEEDGLTRCDVHVRVGMQMREALAAGKPIALDTNTEATHSNGALTETAESILERDVLKVAPEVAREIFRRHTDSLHSDAAAAAAAVAPWGHRSVLSDPAELSPTDSIAWLRQHFDDVDVASVMRWARFRHAKDLMARDRPRYLRRAAEWIALLSARGRTLDEAPLTYMRKSRPLQLAANPNVRVAWIASPWSDKKDGPQQRQRTLLAHEEGFTFHCDGPQTRYVRESFRHPGESIRSRYLALQPVHTEVSAREDFQRIYVEDMNRRSGQIANAMGNQQQQEQLAAPDVRVLHHSVTSELRGGRSASSSAEKTQSMTHGASASVAPEF